MRRSGTSHCDLCHEPAILTEHHINGRDCVGAEDASNKCDICPNCHLAVHYGRIVVEGWVMTTGGLELMWHTAGEESFTGVVATPYIIPLRRQTASADAASGTSKAD
jgi:hypothetical protein